VNQILITGEEQVVEKVKVKKPKEPREKKERKEKKVLPVNGIVLFYAICIIILGICMISGSVYAKAQINKTVEASIKPEITIERNDEDNTVLINVTHIREIKNIAFRWNDEKETIIEGNNRKNISETIDLIGGENTLKIVATEENGQTSTLQKTFIAGNIPEIEIIEAIDNGIKIYASSEDKIEYIEYRWDDEEIQKIEVAENEYEGIINAPQGQHTLKIKVVDVNGMKAELEQIVVGDTEPTLDIQVKLVNENAVFAIDARDDEKIKTISIIHNGGEEQIVEVNEMTYYRELLMTEGEKNTLIVTVTNINNLQKTLKVKFENYY